MTLQSLVITQCKLVREDQGSNQTRSCQLKGRFSRGSLSNSLAKRRGQLVDQLCLPRCRRGGRLQKAINDAVEAGIKRGFLSPSYMREAWRAEMRMLAAEKLSHAEMLVCLVFPSFASYPSLSPALHPYLALSLILEPSPEVDLTVSLPLSSSCILS